MSLLEIKALNKSFGQTHVLKNLSFKVEEGKIIGLLGPNGSGKTTLIKSILQFLKTQSGNILFEGHFLNETHLKDISYLPDHDFLPDDMNFQKILEYYQMFFEDFDVEKAKTLAQNLNIDFEQKIKKMSKGTREKIQLILVVSRQAKLYILDEPIAGVDPAARELIIKTIIGNYNPSSSVLISTHLIADVESILDEFIFLKEGQIYQQGNVDEVREQQGKSLEDLFKEVFVC